MPFDRGNPTFTVCHLPQSLPEDTLVRLQNQAAGSLDEVKHEPQWGWIGNRHLLETTIDEQTAYAGGYLHLGLRQAQRKIPNALLQAECRMQELVRMAEEKLEFLNARAKKEIKQDVINRLLPEMPPQLLGIPFVVDSASQRLYCGTVSARQLDQFCAVFNDTFGFPVIPVTPEEAAEKDFGVSSESIPRLNFSPKQSDNKAAGTIGQDFLTWLWFYSMQHNGVLPKTRQGEFYCVLDGPLLLVNDSDNEDIGSRETAIRKGLPTQSAEAQTALMAGKKLRQAKILCGQGKPGGMADSQTEIVWEVTVDADNFGFRGMKLPEGETLDQDSVFEERINNVHIFIELFFGLYNYFLTQIKDEKQHSAIQKSAQAWVEKWQ